IAAVVHRGTGVGLYQIADGKELAFSPVKGYIESPTFSPNGKILGVPGEKVVTLLDVRTGKVLRQLEGLASSFGHRLTFSRDGAFLAVAESGRIGSNAGATGNLSIQLFDVTSGDEVRQIGGSAVATALAFSPDRRTLAAWHVPDLRQDKSTLIL